MSRSITRAIIAMINIAVSYSVTAYFIHENSDASRRKSQAFPIICIVYYISKNDKAVMAAYGFKPSMTESEIVAELFKMYEKLVQKA